MPDRILLTATPVTVTTHAARESMGLWPDGKLTAHPLPIVFPPQWLHRGTAQSDKPILPRRSSLSTGTPRDPEPHFVEMIQWAQHHLFQGEIICGIFPILGRFDKMPGAWFMQRTQDGVLAHFEYDGIDHVVRAGLWHTYRRPVMYQRPVVPMTPSMLRDMFPDGRIYRADSDASTTRIYGTPEEGGETGWYKLDFSSLLVKGAPLSEWRRWRNFDGIVPAHRSVFATTAIGNIKRLIIKCSTLRREKQGVELRYTQQGWKYRYDSINFSLALDHKTLVSGVKRARILPENKEDFAEAVALRKDMDELWAKLIATPTAIDIDEAVAEVVRLEIRLEAFLGVKVDPEKLPQLVFSEPDKA